MKKKSIIIISVIILLLVVGGIYWYLFFYGKGNPITPVTNPPDGFSPLSNGFPVSNGTSTNNNNNGGEQGQPISNTEPIPSLRLLSNTPIGGYGASTTASTTIVRWVDRGRGNVMEAKGNSLTIDTLSNTILPRTYQSVWNKNISAFIGSLLPSKTDVPTVIYAQLKVQATSTLPKQIISIASTTLVNSNSSSDTQTTNLTPYSLKGKNLPEGMIDYAVSPKGDNIFMLVKESNSGVGYIANFDGTSVVKIFNTPLTQINVDWPEETTIAITTKGSSSQAGFLYFVNTKTGIWKKIVGPIFGLSTKVSRNAKYVLTSGTNKNGSISTNIYSTSNGTSTDAIIRTLADKCVWGNFYKELVYCAVPSEIESSIYPDDWYKGNISFIDKIWQINATNGEAYLVSSIVDQSDRVIDAFNLGLDMKDDFLFFMNKSDLSFWSLDLNAKQ
ncbi:MAG: hypothetical protein WCS89_02945 [Candidatus Paceibacterota bacterium]